ncbi:PREDICTED: ubiquinone biosynthesis O-methyltransferase-like [Atta colombica]|uniref:ubiquinone biosynthesis O-methyltransferase-like n=1 Tax=Atta colombica TaxID=520822 RepID=UPI00084C9013|nr:PREDICTED: ubiquinone biosynthesis O-methyltransferase-like [Atta colombica]
MMTINIVKCFNGSWKSIPRNKLRNIYANRIDKSTSSIDPKKIEHFSIMKNLWWNENGPVTALHSYNPYRIQFMKDRLNAGIKIQNSNLPLKGIKIVDIGCGGGIMAEGLARAGAQVTGIDVSAELISIAKEHLKLDPNISERVNYIHTTVEEFANKESENSTYDAVVASEVLEHVSDPQLFLKECVKIIKPGKSIFITTINKTLTSWLLTIAVEYIKKCVPYGTLKWNKYIAPHKVQYILKNYNCETKLINGMKFNPFTKRWSQSSSVSTLYMLHAIKQK